LTGPDSVRMLLRRFPNHIVNSDAPTLNENHFKRMACADLPGFTELAREFFEDVRGHVAEWEALLAQRDVKRLREEFHRCKGGSALFGFERLVSIFADWELAAAEAAVDALA
jgi:HPt (histidine-containing phosphotransfer) domain-containing protein